jgi:uncharacterized protein YcfJ
MKLYSSRTILSLFLGSSLFVACASGPLTGRESGALAGGALGAGAGAIIGNQMHHKSWEGAAIGAGAGALGGAIVGDQSDAAARRRYDDRYDRSDRYDRDQY